MPWKHRPIQPRLLSTPHLRNYSIIPILRRSSIGRIASQRHRGVPIRRNSGNSTRKLFAPRIRRASFNIHIFQRSSVATREFASGTSVVGGETYVSRGSVTDGPYLWCVGIGTAAYKRGYGGVEGEIDCGADELVDWVGVVDCDVETTCVGYVAADFNSAVGAGGVASYAFADYLGFGCGLSVWFS